MGQESSHDIKRPKRLLALIGPGLLIAATGVGAGDLDVAGFAGNELGTAVLWAVIVGCFLKFVLTEGLARWQLATGDTLLEGCSKHMGRPFQIAFVLYLIPWCFFTGSAMMSACGVTLYAILPVLDNPDHAQIVFGILSSLVGIVLVRFGGYRLFARAMKICVAVMFFAVVYAAIRVRPDWGAVVEGIFVPRIPDFDGKGLLWTVALLGGVGGTVTLLSYGYWIREEGREGAQALRACRIDLAAGYAMTAVFCLAMVIIGSVIHLDQKGVRLVVEAAEKLGATIGPFARWIFLIGALGTVFSSLLGVWQSAPYLIADFFSLVLGEDDAARAKRLAVSSRTYTMALLALAIIPMINLARPFKDIQFYYAVYGALFMPFLAFSLLYLNSRSAWIGQAMKNRSATTIILATCILFFAWFGYYTFGQRGGG